MNARRAFVLAAAGTVFAAAGCFPSAKTSPPIETAGNAVDREVSAVQAVDQWRDFSASAARLLMSEYGVPDEVNPDSLVWNNNGPWRRTVVRNARPSAVAGEDLGIVEQTLSYAVTRPQASNLAAFDDRLVFIPRAGELSARSDREEFNILRLNLADDVVHGRSSPAQARDAYFKTLALEEAGKTSPDLLRLRLTP